MMSLKTKYILFVSITLLAFSVLTALLYNQNKYLFLIGEGIIVVTLILSILFYKLLLRPYKIMNSGVESIADKDFSIKFLPVGQPEPDRLIEVYNKMIDQLRLERANATETHFFLQKLIEATPAGIVILGENNHIKSTNPAARKLLNTHHENEETEITKLSPPWNKELLKLKENKTILVQMNGINQYKCHKSVFLDRGVKRTFFIIEELTQELLHAEKIAYEKVIRMISHEVNNSMGAVNSIIDSTKQFLIKKENKQASDFIHALDVARERISNLNNFTKRFSEVVRIPSPDIRKCNLKDTIARVLVYFKAELDRRNIVAATHIHTDIDVVIPFDIQQLELVLINIVKNAIQAIGSNGNINAHIHAFPLTLTIENNGEPIPQDTQEKLFTPFFTTKKTGQGVGLILIREILVNHNCKFSLRTRNDRITAFRIQFANEI